MIPRHRYLLSNTEPFIGDRQAVYMTAQASREEADATPEPSGWLKIPATMHEKDMRAALRQISLESAVRN